MGTDSAPALAAAEPGLSLGLEEVSLFPVRPTGGRCTLVHVFFLHLQQERGCWSGKSLSRAGSAWACDPGRDAGGPGDRLHLPLLFVAMSPPIHS